MNADILCFDNWNILSAIANICIAILAFITYLYTRSQGKKQDKLRFEDVRARLSFSIIVWHDHYMLKVTNVGKETAYNIELNVSGSPISDNLFSFVKKVFANLLHTTICVEAGQSVFYLVSPTENASGSFGIDGQQQVGAKDIRAWLKKHDKEDIIITGKYNNRHIINERFCIRDYAQYGAFEHKEAIEEIADAILSRDPQDTNIQKNFQLIAEIIKKQPVGGIKSVRT
ncbi:MAG: hypothetical protein I3J02_06165 [Prevotella sp.]|nr:hypothetical protein [Prevotella sp.]